MKERPILFSGEMVRAILDGRKTQTRRIVKDSETDSRIYWNPIVVNEYGGWVNEHGSPRPCRYGQPGDRLWVRETWSQDGRGGTDAEGRDAVYYRADFPHPDVWEGFWKPSIHMPRWASRITLEVTSVRVTRLQEISDKDARAEGCPGWYHESYPDQGEPDAKRPTEEFAELWESINGAGSWDLNPWVWVIEFKRIDVR